MSKEHHLLEASYYESIFNAANILTIHCSPCAAKGTASDHLNNSCCIRHQDKFLVNHVLHRLSRTLPARTLHLNGLPWYVFKLHMVLDKQLTWYRLGSSQSVLALVPRSWGVPSPRRGLKGKRRRLLLYVANLY